MQQHEKTSLRYVFFRLYSNDELLDFLKEQLKNGLVLDHCKGNFFFFRRWQLQNARLCVISIPCSKPRVEDDDEVQEYLDIAKRKGWQLLCVGDYESLLPMRRRLYFYTCDDRAQPLEQDEAADFQNAYRAYHASLRSSVAWVLLAALGLVATVPFMLADGLNFAMPVLDAALLVSACAAMTLHLNRRTLYRSVTKKTPLPEDLGLRLRRCENLRLWSMGAVLAASFLIRWQKTPERLKQSPRHFSIRRCANPKHIFAGCCFAYCDGRLRIQKLQGYRRKRLPPDAGRPRRKRLR